MQLMTRTKLVCIVSAMNLQALSHRSHVKVNWPSICLLFHVSYTEIWV